MTSNPLQILAINPGSTSTKVGFFEDEAERFAQTLSHSASDLVPFPRIWDQFEYRLNAIRVCMAERISRLDAVVGMGGLLKPVEGGTYAVNELMIRDARDNLQGEHASNLGCALASSLAEKYRCPAFVVDPVSVDEFEPLARYSGHPSIERKSLSHALNIHAAARRAANELRRPLPDTRFVIAHLGGGISIAAVVGGRIVDVNDASSDGPFSPERTGGLPLQPVITVAFSGSHSEQELRKMVMGKGGLVAYLGTNSAKDVERLIANGDRHADEVYSAMTYQIAKEIGAMSCAASGHLDSIVLTGGLAASALLTGRIAERIRHLGSLIIYPGDNELQSLAFGALRVLRGEEPAKEY